MIQLLWLRHLDVTDDEGTLISALILAWVSHGAIRWPLTVIYLALLGLVALYGLHRYWLVYLYWRYGKNGGQPPRRYDPLPVITVQLPMFNEPAVAERVIDAACQLDYPRDRLQIQVLDDSIDQTVEIASRRCEHWSNQGVDIEYHHRVHRQGYKAGALAEGLLVAKGEFIAIFDADFVPPPPFLRQTIDYFTDPGVGMVQARWDHLNRDESLLTRCQAIFLDGHFVIEHTARNRSQRWINFNGTAGIWRRQAIESAGGWQHDTLTEDVDLSYRSQMCGWHFVFLPDLTCPAELPPEINALKAQQHRWTKGSIQTAMKLWPRLLRSKAPWRVKIEAFIHLTSPLVYLYVTLMALLFFPAFYVNMQPFEEGSMGAILLGVSLFALGTISASVFYLVSQRVLGRSLWATMAAIPLLMSLGIGLAVNNARACIEALLGHQSAFVRTPKYNSRGSTRSGLGCSALNRLPLSLSTHLRLNLLELALGVYVFNCARLSLQFRGAVISFPFLMLFTCGYLYVGLSGLRAHWANAHPSAQSLPQLPRSGLSPHD